MYSYSFNNAPFTHEAVFLFKVKDNILSEI